MSRPPAAWSTEGLVYRYTGSDKAALDGVDATISAGHCTAVLGPNGSGKSTLLRLLLGTLRPDSGRVTYEGRSVSDWERRDFARAVGVVPQDEEIAFPITVRELVAMGRYPRLGLLRGSGPADREAVERALEQCDLIPLAGRSMSQLSGGERQRARIARALAQEPAALALDEPTRALDIRHEMEILELVRDLVGVGVTVVLVTHNLNLAARYADRLLMLDRGKVAGEGRPEEVLTEELVKSVYRWPIALGRHTGPGPDTGVVQVTPLARDRSVGEGRGGPESRPAGS